jgi:thiamine transport system permease protein
MRTLRRRPAAGAPNRLAMLLGVLAVLFLAVFYLWPLLAILQRSFADGGGLQRILRDPYYWSRLGFTTWQALLSTLLTLLLGVPGALLFSRYDFPGKRLLRSAFTIPFVMPSVVTGMGFLALLGPRGVLGTDLRGSLTLVLLAHVFYNYSIVVRLVGAYLESVAPRLQEAAATLGTSAWRTLWRVTLPLARPALLASAALVFTFTFTSFGVILILAPALATVEVEIYRLTARLLQLDAAATLALLQLLIISIITWFYSRWQARLAVPVTGAALPLPRPRGAARWLVALNLLLAGLLILSPLLALAGQAFWQAGSPLPTLDSFRTLLAAPRTAMFPGAGRAVLNSLQFALGSMVLSLLIGTSFAYAVVRARWNWLDSTSLLPLATSSVTLGFGYLLAFPALTVSPWGLLLAHTLIGYPFVTRSVLPALRGIPPNLTAAALSLGATAWSRLRRVDLPLLVPSLLTAAAFAFAISMGEFGATLVITRPEYATIPVAIFDRLGRAGAANYASALALSVLLMLVTATVMLLLERFGQSEI